MVNAWNIILMIVSFCGSSLLILSRILRAKIPSGIITEAKILEKIEESGFCRYRLSFRDWNNNMHERLTPICLPDSSELQTGDVVQIAYFDCHGEIAEETEILVPESVCGASSLRNLAVYGKIGYLISITLGLGMGMTGVVACAIQILSQY